MVTYHPNSTAVCGIQNLNLRTKRSSMILTLSDKKATFLGGVKSSRVACHSEVLFDGEKSPKMHVHVDTLSINDVDYVIYIYKYVYMYKCSNYHKSYIQAHNGFMECMDGVHNGHGHPTACQRCTLSSTMALLSWRSMCNLLMEVLPEVVRSNWCIQIEGWQSSRTWQHSTHWHIKIQGLCTPKTTLWQTLTITQLTLLYLKIHPCLEA